MKSKQAYSLAIVIGTLAGFLSARVFLIGWYNLPFWGLVGLFIGFFIKNKRTIIRAGVLYGFFLSISFLFSGFEGSEDKVLGFTILSLALSLVGMLGGIVSLHIGRWVKENWF